MVARDQLLFGAAGAALIAVALGMWLLLAPAPNAEAGADQGAGIGFVASGAPAEPSPAEPETLLIDVEGGVAKPGIAELPSGARIGDAIAAAGGYAEDADILAAAAALNLAAPLSDGQQVYVPIIGVAQAPSDRTSGGGGGGGGAGLVNVNTATPEQLDALPGIGPVTVQKIVAARQEKPFGALEELVERKVLNTGQLDKVRDLVTV